MRKIFILDAVLFLLAIIATYFIVISGFDWQYFQFVSQYPWLRIILNPALGIGGLLPMVISLVVAGFYWKYQSRVWMNQLSKVLLAIIFAVAIDSFMKALTGRPHPPTAVGFVGSAMNALASRDAPAIVGALVDNSHIFNFGFMRAGVFWGWPSGHTMVAFAMATTFAKLNAKNWKIVILSYLYAFYVAAGVSLRIHWFSDAVAGVLIGYAIGQTVALWKKKL